MGISEVLQKGRSKTADLALVGTVLLSSLAVITRTQVPNWQNSMTLMEHALDVNAGNTAAHVTMT